MFKFEIEKWLPQFVLNDKNGYALAKAIEVGLQMLNDAIADGLKLIDDYDSMPEWRLDELAWETNCLYDYNAPIETKREWIKNSAFLYGLYGTPMAILQYLGGYFEKVNVQENWEYCGEPYHFCVIVEGNLTPENEAWARKAIDTSKNVRSVLDSLKIGYTCCIGLQEEKDVPFYSISYPMTGENLCGTIPEPSTVNRSLAVSQGILTLSGKVLYISMEKQEE
nr:phage tail protein [uncultured Blautia sp.]